MAIQVTLDISAGSQIERFGNASGSAIRAGRATGLSTTSGMTPEDVLHAITVAPGMPAMGTTHPGDSNIFLTRVRVFGIAQSGDAAAIQLIYEPFGGIGTSLIIEMSSSLSTFTTNIMPGTQEPIEQGFTPSGGDGTSIASIAKDYIPINMLRANARVTVTQLKSGTLDIATMQAFADQVERVNNATWLGRPAGSWIIADASASVSKYAGYYQTRLTAMRQGEDRWIYFGMLFSNLVGKYALSQSVRDEITRLKALAYTPQTLHKQTDKGVVRADPYLTANFATAFGFGGVE